MTSYTEIAATAADPSFNQRVTACGVEQALTFVNDGRPEFSAYAQAVITSASTATQLVWPVAGKPGITKDSPDPDILAAVQAVWALVGQSYVPAAAP